jgi:DNA-binding MarR family transcriptional regulator
MENPRKVFLIQQTYATLFSLANKLQVRGDQYMQRLTSRQFMAMLAIIHLPEDNASLNNIARMLGVTKQNVKQLITIIERKGYVITEPNQRDRRAVNIKITEAGRQVMIEGNTMGMKFFADLFNGFTIEELEVLWGLLKKLYRFDGEEQAGFEEEIAFS